MRRENVCIGETSDRARKHGGGCRVLRAGGRGTVFRAILERRAAMIFLKRLYFTFLKSHTHVKPTLEGEGWQVIHDNVLVSFADDVIVYGIGTAWHNLKAGARMLWAASGGG